MGTKTIAFDQQCPKCSGTGLYAGMAEFDGAAVVCHTCKGTGCHHYSYTYTEFTRRKKKNGIKRVYEANPGISIGKGNGYALEDFGGMPYTEWEKGNPFPPGSEDRNHTCPAWWYQTADYSRKPDWEECLGVGSFSSCKHFCEKAKCWARWDRENQGGS